MEAKELRLGNYIMDSPINGNKPLEVHAIYSNLVIHEDTHIYNDEIRPIPLTKEWLLKFGFTNYENESWFWSFDFNSKQETFKVFQLTANGEPFGLWGGLVGCPQLMKKIEFVHQLQNLYFCLCGKELDLTLSKTNESL